MTQTQAADAAGITQEEWCRYECGHVMPTAPMLARMSAALRCETSVLIPGPAIHDNGQLADLIAGKTGVGLGMLKATVRVKADPDAERFFDAEFLLDSGVRYTVAPEALLVSIGIKPREERTFTLANGEKITRRVGFAYFEAVGQSGPAKIIFGQPGDSNLLGATALEALEVALDPVRRELNRCRCC